MFLNLFKNSGKSASELAGEIEKYPQVLKNVTANNDQKAAYKADAEIAAFIAQKEAEMGDEGRVLVRLSGTEPLIRVMVEGKDMETIDRVSDEIVAKITERVL